MKLEQTVSQKSLINQELLSLPHHIRQCGVRDRFVLSTEEAFARGENSELRVACWLEDKNIFPWITTVLFEKACNPYFDLTVHLDPEHRMTEILNLAHNILRVEVKSSLTGRNHYVRHKRRNFSPATWYENGWVVIPAGPHITDQKLKEQLTFQLLVISRRYVDSTQWPALFEQLDPSFVDAFLQTVYSESLWSRTMLQYLGQSRN